MKSNDMISRFKRNNLLKWLGIASLVAFPAIGALTTHLLKSELIFNISSVLGLLAFITGLLFYRCPNCKKSFDPRTHSIRFCNYCGIELKEKKNNDYPIPPLDRI